MPCMDWELFIREIEALSEKVDFRPDIIIGIARGGVIPARLLSTHLQVKEMHCLTVKKISGGRKIATEILENLEHKKVLLIEDMLESGKSLEAAKGYLESKGAEV